MDPYTKKTEASDVGHRLERGRDPAIGSEKTKHDVKIASFIYPLHKHANTGSSSSLLEEEDEEEEINYIDIKNLYKITCQVLPYDSDDFKSKYQHDDTLVEQVRRLKFSKINPNNEEVSEDDDDDLWSSEEEGEEEDEEEDDKEEIVEDEEQVDEEEEEEDDEEEEFGDDEGEDEYDVYARRVLTALCEMRKRFCRRVLDRSDVKDGCSAKQVYQRLKKANWARAMPESEAMEYINYAVGYYSKNKSRQRSSSVKKLIHLVPCITVDTGAQEPNLFIDACINSGIRGAKAVYHWLYQIFYDVEYFYHPLIRKTNLKEIVWLSRRDANIAYRKSIQEYKYFDVDVLNKRREDRISKEDLQYAFKMVRLHQDFDLHLTSCSFLNERSKIKDLMMDDNVVLTRFKKLDDSLIKASLRWRVRLLKKVSEYKRYVAWVLPIIERKAIKDCTTKLEGVLEAIRKSRTTNFPNFPNLSDVCILDQKPVEYSSFCGLLSEIKRFLKCHVSDRYLVDAILVYMEMCSDLKDKKTIEDKMEVYAHFVKGFQRRLGRLDEVWGTRHYEHPIYNALFGPVR